MSSNGVSWSVYPFEPVGVVVSVASPVVFVSFGGFGACEFPAETVSAGARARIAAEMTTALKDVRVARGGVFTTNAPRSS